MSTQRSWLQSHALCFARADPLDLCPRLRSHFLNRYNVHRERNENSRANSQLKQHFRQERNDQAIQYEGCKNQRRRASKVQVFEFLWRSNRSVMKLVEFDGRRIYKKSPNRRDLHAPEADCLTIPPCRNKLHAMRELLERLFQIDFIKGLAVTFRMQNPKEIVTEQYPLERPMVAERYRGAPRLNNNPETGETLCIGCNLCALACPENLIVVGWLRDDATRRKVLTHFTYDTSRCMFCGLCEDACPTDALELTQDFEMAYYTREGAIWDRHRLEQGPTPARYTR